MGELPKLVAAIAGAVAAIVVGLLVFGNSVVSRAEAHGAQSEVRIERRLVRIEEKVDRLIEARNAD